MYFSDNDKNLMDDKIIVTQEKNAIDNILNDTLKLCA